MKGVFWDLSDDDQRQQIIIWLNDLADDGIAPSAKRWDRQRPDGAPSRNRIEKLFGCWSNAVNAAGLLVATSRPAGHFWRNHTEADVIDQIVEMSVDGYAPSRRQWDENRPDRWPTANNIERRLGQKWGEIAATAGLKKNKPWGTFRNRQRPTLSEIDAEVEGMMCPPERAHLKESMRLVRYKNGTPRRHWCTVRRSWRDCVVYKGEFV